MTAQRNIDKALVLELYTNLSISAVAFRTERFHAQLIMHGDKREAPSMEPMQLCLHTQRNAHTNASAHSQIRFINARQSATTVRDSTAFSGY